MKSKQYIIRKYVMAKSIAEALRIEKKTKPNYIVLNEDYKEPEDVKEKVITGLTTK